MGSMERMVNFKYTRLEMLTMKPSVDDKIVDYTQDHTDVDNDKNLNVKLSVDHEVARDNEYLIKACRSCYNHVPKKSRTHRFIVGNLRYDPEEGVEYFYSTQMIVDEKKTSLDEKNSRNAKKSLSDKDYVVCGDDYGEEKSSKNKRQKAKIQKKTADFTKAVQVYDLPTELPQNLKEYISRLNLEVPPLFVAQKLLTVSDITSNQGRLLLPNSLINAEFLDNFLTEDEKKLMMKTKPVEVNLVDDMLHEYNTLHMTKWVMNSSSPYVLRKAWNNVVAENKLKRIEVLKDKRAETIVGMEDGNKLVTDVVVRVWSFRRESNIWFALNMQTMTEVKILGKTKEGCYIIE